MTRSNKPETTETFARMFYELEESGDLYIEWAKINIAEQIYLAMKREDVSKAELSRRLGKSRAYVTQILQGGANFTVESLVKIARALNYQFEVKFSPKCVLNHWEYPDRRNLAEEGSMWKRDDYIQSPVSTLSFASEDTALAA
jgi:transcriptional regulator with XRE-family HTH domain